MYGFYAALSTQLFKHSDFIKYDDGTVWRWYDPAEPYSENGDHNSKTVQWTVEGTNTVGTSFNFTDIGNWGGVRLFREGRVEYPSIIQDN